MIAAVVAIVLAGGVVWMLMPLWDRRHEDSGAVAEEAEELLELKQAAYRGILDLEADRDLGKVSDEDFRVMRRQHEAEALKALRALDSLTSEDTAADLLEREIAAARRRLRGDR